MQGYTTVSIPKPLADKIKKRIAKTGFSSVSDYVIYVLREVISNIEEKGKKEAFSKEEEELIRRRLKGLGY